MRIKGFTKNNQSDSGCITFPDIQAADVAGFTYPDDNHVTLEMRHGKNLTIAIEGIKKHACNTVADKMAQHKREVCFLAGALLRTPQGDKPVETLRYGDTICTYNWQKKLWEKQEIVWAGRRTTHVRPNLPDDEAGYPVRILKDALADGVPYQDLVVTAEHALFFENKFIPIRMLVNGRSIFFDHSIKSYTYYHVETEQHSVIMANGALTETFLDTVSRRLFYQTGNVVALRFSKQSWQCNGAAPLALKQADVEPVHANLAKRALLHDNPMRMPPLEITTDPEIHLVTDKGQTIRKARKIGCVVMFMVPTDVRGIRIVSRTSRPADSIGPFVNDRRTRGILISDITYLDTVSSRYLNTHLNEIELDGWALLDDKAARWTKGNAFLPLPHCGAAGFAMLSFRVLAGGPYIRAPFHKTGSSQFSVLGQKPYVA